MLEQAARDYRIDLARSWLVGDILHDVEAGRRAGCRTVLLDVGHETEWELTPVRTPDYTAADLTAAVRVILAQSARPALTTHGHAPIRGPAVLRGTP